MSEADYGNTIIYKITCKNPEIKELYVGHTTNFVQRKRSHKQCSNNPNSSSSCKLYDFIRQNGGWDNWVMEIIHFCKCNGLHEARQKEQEFFVSLNATLNTVEPMPKVKDNTSFGKKYNKTESGEKYSCEKCDFKCCKLSNWTKHISTTKHINRTSLNDLEQTKCNNFFMCKFCDKPYRARNSLWYHENKCNMATANEEHIEKSSDNKVLLDYLIKQNSELQKQILDVCKNNMVNNISQVNSHIKTFNLRVFLNEDC